MSDLFDNYLTCIDHLSTKERQELWDYTPANPWDLTMHDWIYLMLGKEFGLSEEKAETVVGRYWLLWKMHCQEMDAREGKRKLGGRRQ